MGFETGGRKAVSPLLLHKYQELKTIGQIDTETPTVTNRKSFQAADKRIDQEVISADRLASDPQLAPLASQLHLDHLALSDPIQAAYSQTVFHKYQGDLEQIAQGGPAERHLEQHEFRAFLMLTGDKLSKEEAHMLRMFEPLMSLEQRETYRAARAKDWDLEEKAVGPAEMARLALQMYAPYTPVMGAAVLGGYGLVTGEALSVVLITAMSGGFTVGEYLQKKAIGERKGTYGVNYLEDPQITNDLLRLQRRAAEPLPTDLEQLPARLEGDVALFDAVLGLRGRAPHDAAREHPILDQFRSYLGGARLAESTLQTMIAEANGQPIDPAVIRAKVLEPLARSRASLLEKVDVKDLDQLAAGIRPERILNEEQLRVAVNRLVAINVSETLSIVNAPLAHSVTRLETELDIERHLDKRDAPKLDADSIAALRVAVGKEPSLPEIMGLSRLVFAGALELKDLWPNVDFKLLPGAQKLDARELIEDVAKLGFDDHAKWLERLGKGLKGPLSQIMGVGAMSAVILLTELAFFPYGFVAGFGPRLLGQFLGSKLETKALEMRATKGIDYVGGRPNATEYEVLLDRYADPKLFSGSPAELQEQARREAGVIRKTIEGLRAIMPMLGERDRADLQKHQEPIYQALTEFAQKLDSLSKGDPNLVAAGIQQASATLFRPEVQRIVQRDILRQASVDDFVADPRARWVHARIALLNAIKTMLDQGSGGMAFPEFVSAWKNNRLRNDTFVQLAKAVREAGDEYDRSRLSIWQKIASGIPFVGKQFTKGHELDEVEQFASQVLAKRWDPTALSDLVKLYDHHEELTAKLDTDLREHWPVDEKRATEIAQEMLGVMWQRVHPLLGHAADGAEAPKFVGSAEIMTDGPAPYFLVKGQIDGGKRGERGTLEMRVDAYGLVDLDSIKLDLGEAVLRKFAAESTEKANGGSAKKVELLGRTDAGYDFAVSLKNGQQSTVHLTPDGFARLT